jgi:hypothetical protein
MRTSAAVGCFADQASLRPINIVALLFCEILPLLLVHRPFFHAKRPGWGATHHGVLERSITGPWPLLFPAKGVDCVLSGKQTQINKVADHMIF